MTEKKPVSILILGSMWVIGVVLGVVIVVAVIGWWSAWATIQEFQRAIQMAGILVIGIGLMGLMGNLQFSRRIEYQYSMTVTKDHNGQRIQQTVVDLTRAYAFTLIMFFSGVICLAIGWLL